MVAASKRFFQRKLRRSRGQVETIGEQAEIVAERYFFRRLERLTAVRRFVIGWLILVTLLCGCLVGQIRALDGYFQSLHPADGGIYSEGIVGDFTNASPLYASTPVDETVSRLLFAGLFKYNDDNQLVGDLASGYTVDATGKIYTVKLKPNLKWHDGEPLTARDVVFTYGMIQNPDAQSVLNSSWQGVAVAAVNDTTVTFTLPSVLASFPYNMTNGIVPQHILKDVTPSEMRSVNFNTESPIGAGPFQWRSIEVSGESPETREYQIALAPFDSYNAGSPKLSSFIVHAYHAESQLAKDFKDQQLTAASFVDPSQDILHAKGVLASSFMMSAADMVFFKQTSPTLSDVAVRRALVQSVNVPALIDGLGYATHQVREPLLVGQLGYDPAYVQAGFDMRAAQAALDAAGWKVGPNGMRMKGTQPLRFTLYAQDMSETRSVATQLAQAWRSIGVDPIVKFLSSEDLQRSIASRDYDALLYGISIGVDPDVFVYWHSSQTDIRSAGLNFSDYKNKTADLALEAGRTRIEPDLRAIKYKPFLQAWKQDVPALGLYQPRYTYLTHGTVFGLNEHVLNTNTDRFNNVQNWQIRQVSVTNQVR